MIGNSSSAYRRSFQESDNSREDAVLESGGTNDQGVDWTLHKVPWQYFREEQGSPHSCLDEYLSINLCFE